MSKSKGQGGAGKGKSNGKSGPPIPQELRGKWHKTPSGEPICFGFNCKSGCPDKPGQRCSRGYHVSAKQAGLASSIAADKLRKKGCRSTSLQLDLGNKQHQSLLERWLQSSLLVWVHLAPVCGTPQLLRSNSEPKGLSELHEKDACRVCIANELFAYSCRIFEMACPEEFGLRWRTRDMVTSGSQSGFWLSWLQGIFFFLRGFSSLHAWRNQRQVDKDCWIFSRHFGVEHQVRRRSST